MSAAALLVGLLRLWTSRRGLEANSFQATFCRPSFGQVPEVHGRLGSAGGRPRRQQPPRLIVCPTCRRWTAAPCLGASRVGESARS